MLYVLHGAGNGCWDESCRRLSRREQQSSCIYIYVFPIHKNPYLKDEIPFPNQPLLIMDIQYIIDRAQGIILNPKEEWRRIKEEPKSNAELLLYYVLPLVVMAVFTGFIGSWSLTIAVFRLISPFIGIVIAAYVINELAEKFNSTKNLNNAFKLVVYAATPSLLAAIVANLSFLLGWVSLFGLYGIYLFWVGIVPMMDTPEDKRLGYVLASALVIVIIQIVLFTLIGPSMMWR